MIRLLASALGVICITVSGLASAQDYSPAPVDTDPSTFTPREPTVAPPAEAYQPQEPASAGEKLQLGRAPGPMTMSSGTPEEPVVEWDKRQDVEERLRVYGPDLLGDQIDPHTGAISFQHTDVSLPGNSQLEVAIRRKLSQGLIYHESVDVEFGDWEIMVPRIHALTANGAWAGNRCSNSYFTSFPLANAGAGNLFVNNEYSEGVVMDVPGAGGMQVLETKQGAHWPAAATHTTTEGWWLECTTASDGGEGFIAHAPNGDTYTFDDYIAVQAKDLGVWGSTTLTRTRKILAASEVTDVHGNWVRYDYDVNGRLTRIHANDGREITLSYSGASKLISSVTANGRTWQYSYGGTTYSEIAEIGYFGSAHTVDVLRTVTQPDGRSWSFQLDGMIARSGPGTQCVQAPQTLTVTHPYGMVGTFQLYERVHRQSNGGLAQITYSCPNDPDIIFNGTPPPIFTVSTFETMSVTSKTMSGPNVPSSTWTYEYEEDQSAVVVPDCSAPGADCTNWTKVQDPTGAHITYYHYWNMEVDGGAKLAERQVREGSETGTLLHTEIHEYELENLVGTTFMAGVPHSTTRPSRQIQSTIWRKGDMFRSHNTYNVNHASANYSHGFPVTVGQWSSTAGGYAARRETDTDYEHNATKWVLGLPTKVTRNGVIFDEHDYDSFGRRLWTDMFGVRQRTFTYHTTGVQAGLVNTVDDALNRTTTLANYKRGEPQTITRPDTISTYSTVDDNGWRTSLTNARGHKTDYQYNNMGWLTLIDRPGAFDSTVIDYFNLGAIDFYQRNTRGSERVVTWYDAMFRPIRTRTSALTGGGVTSYVASEYDINGRETFRSFPTASSAPTDGMDTTYDALGRVTLTKETVAPYAETSTQYLSLFRVRTTDPLLNETTQHLQAYGSPDEAQVLKIDQETDVTTEMTYDIYGKMTSARQHGAHNGFVVDQTQNYYYDDRERLCRHSVPETGDAIFRYNDANELKKTASGQPSGTTCVAPPALETTTRVYDVLGRLEQINYGDGVTPNVTIGYDANGNVTSNARDGADWTYSYDAMDNLRRETLVVDGRTYTTRYTYTNESFLDTQETPGGRVIDYAPNGLGQATGAAVGATDYADAIVYAADGQLTSLDYGNGHVLTRNYNNRRLLSLNKVALGPAKAIHFNYSYDDNHRITSITDNVDALQNRAFTYDGLGRLATATGPWGVGGAQASGSFTYDSLGNLRKKILGSRVVDIQYLGNNRINRARDTDDGSIWRDYVHDDRGNVTDNDRVTLDYDLHGQPTALGGASTGAFEYDGNFKRVFQVIDSEEIYSVYSLSGAILYRDNKTTGETTDYIKAAGMTVARIKDNGTVTTSYLHPDHLGSPAAATDSLGVVEWREDYTPFGEERQDDPANDNDENFTGHIRDENTGLIYMQARYMDPVIGRFLSNDPVGFSPDQPQYFNRYSYALNDPVNFIDPTGMCSSIANEDTQADCFAKREDAISNAKEHVADASVRAGAKEEAYIEVYNEDTGEVSVRTGDDAAIRTGDDVVFTDSEGGKLYAQADGRVRTQNDDGTFSDTNEVILATGHSHPKISGLKANDPLNRSNNSIRQNPADQALSEIAPAVIKGPNGKVKVYENGKERK